MRVVSSNPFMQDLAVAFPKYQENKVAIALFAGSIVFLVAAMVDLGAVPAERSTVISELVGDLIAGLVATLLFMAVQLKYEEIHHRFAMERAAIVVQLNHRVRDAVFPLCLAVEKIDDAESKRVSGDATERINIALKNAAAEAFARKVEDEHSRVVELGSERAA